MTNEYVNVKHFWSHNQTRSPIAPIPNGNFKHITKEYRFSVWKQHKKGCSHRFFYSHFFLPLVCICLLKMLDRDLKHALVRLIWGKVNFLLICLSEMFPAARKHLACEDWMQILIWSLKDEGITPNLWPRSFLLYEWINPVMRLQRGCHSVKADVIQIQKITWLWIFLVSELFLEWRRIKIIIN